MKNRPHIHLGIQDLKELANDIDKDPKVMKEIVAELKHRKTAKAKTLLEKMTTRPFLGHTIGELTKITKINSKEETSKKDIIKELLFRSTPQAKKLLRELLK
jgi:hypothetical protein